MANDLRKAGLVTNITGNLASIQLTFSKNCEHCKAQVACIPKKLRTRTLVATNNVDAKIGQSVIIKENGNFMLLLSFMQFGVPLLGLLIGIFIASTFFSNFSYFPPELFMTLIGFVGLITGGLITRVWAKNTSLHSPCPFEIIIIPPIEQI